MSKIYEILYDTQYLTKGYHFVDYIQNTPRNEKDEEGIQNIINTKYHQYFEKIIGDKAFISGSGTGITIDTVNSRYEIDGSYVLDGVFFDFDDVTILDENGNTQSYPIASNGYFYIKVVISTVTYLDDSSIAIQDPVTPS